jgi:hypothetical protein
MDGTGWHCVRQLQVACGVSESLRHAPRIQFLDGSSSAGRVVEPSSAPGGGEQASRLGWGSGLARTVRDSSSPRGSQQSAEIGVRAADAGAMRAACLPLAGRMRAACAPRQREASA